MGQYYKPVNLDTKQYVSCYDFENGAKLMEHSYIGNKFVNAITGLMKPNMPWYKTRIVWSGDYADPTKYITKKELTAYKKYLQKYDADRLFDYPYIALPNLYSLCVDPIDVDDFKLIETKITTYKRIKPKNYNTDDMQDPYLVNYTKKEYIDLRKVPKEYWKDAIGKKWEYTIHPLPLLTADGNGRGGGDYHGINMELVGIWAGDILAFEKINPFKFKQVGYYFKEETEKI